MPEEKLIIPENVVKYVIGRGIPKTEPNQTTDDMIYGEFLNKVTFVEMAKFLYYRERFINGEPVLDHPFNDPKYKGGKIIVGGKNFGCGSSREHAPAAMRIAGIRGIIAPDYAGIFRENCAENKIVAATLSEDRVMTLADVVREHPETEITINLETGMIEYGGISSEFGLPDSIREAFLTGTWDSLPLLQANADEVAEAMKRIAYFSMETNSGYLLTE